MVNGRYGPLIGGKSIEINSVDVLASLECWKPPLPPTTQRNDLQIGGLGKFQKELFKTFVALISTDEA